MNWQIVFDTATGQRAYRSIVEHARSRALSLVSWAAEIAGIVVIAAGVWTVSPAVAFVIIGVYLILAGQALENKDK